MRPTGTVDTPRVLPPPDPLVSIGYEGKTVGDLVAQPLEQDVRVLVGDRTRYRVIQTGRLDELLGGVDLRLLSERMIGSSMVG